MSLEQMVLQSKIPDFLAEEARNVIRRARAFRSSFLDQKSVEFENKSFEDKSYVPQELADELNRQGLLNLWLPRAMGGGGYHPQTMYLFNEELAQSCLGAANLLGAHYLALSVLSAAQNIRLMNQLFKKIEQGRRQKKPCLFSIAVTEPNAGTDVEDYRLIERAQIGCIAKKTEGGFLLNGRKMFISGSHLSSWYIVVAYEKKKDPIGSVLSFAIPKKAKGFSIGKPEFKMGQTSCPASELIFSNCFVPDSHVVVSGEVLSQCGEPQQLNEILHEDVIAMSRTGVAAFSAGVCKKSFAIARDYLAEKKPACLDQQVVQKKLAEIHTRYVASRSLYLDSVATQLFRGPMRHHLGRKAYRQSKKTPLWIQKLVVGWLCLTPRKTQVRWLKRRFSLHDPAAQNTRSALGSMVKKEGTERAMQSIRCSFELLGKDSIKSEYGLERLLRDAKLLEIYEGSGDINSLNFLYRSQPELKIDVREYDG